MSEHFLFLLAAAFFAGLVDSVGGGGGLIQVPALFSGMPQTMPATLFGTNKLASIWGTGAAAVNYARRVHIEWNAALPATAAAFVFAFLGAFSVTWMPADLMRKCLPILLIVLLVYTWRFRQFGLLHAPLYRGKAERMRAVALGAVIGFYDGFFGPGTGSFLIFLFVRFFGFDFLGASVASKIVNVACNFAALLWFGYSGHVLWLTGLAMAVCNVAGSLAGSRLALRHGSLLVRRMFLLVVSALILKAAKDAFFR
jgi:hypothetical protein